MKPLDCNELVEMITAYLDGSLDLETRARFDEHLLDCDGCDNYLQRSVRWHVEYGGNPALAATATDAITVLTDPRYRDQLRRCANPDCSMLFLATNPRRSWCTANICGNRARVARHYHRRTHTTG
ncbi:CGNR zinc finger domain-containing protein [Mycobacterium avium]|uniref:CGNR zinc finger domain-containing protein n=1 Tax=Mycobacterium avium TaxID=1764 RepID=UPI0020C79D43|nr:CGNR zinc finger domain-containing protein [Mycobacterium avium]